MKTHGRNFSRRVQARTCKPANSTRANNPRHRSAPLPVCQPACLLPCLLACLATTTITIATTTTTTIAPPATPIGWCICACVGILLPFARFRFVPRISHRARSRSSNLPTLPLLLPHPPFLVLDFPYQPLSKPWRVDLPVHAARFAHPIHLPIRQGTKMKFSEEHCTWIPLS